MDHLLNISKAARLVGISRGMLQRQIQDGELESFEGQVRMQDLAKLYPNTNMKSDMENLERYEQIIEEALQRARNRKMQALLTPDPATLAARAASLNRELAHTRTKLYRYELLFRQLSERLQSPGTYHIDEQSAKTLLRWLDDAIQPNVNTSELYHLLDQEGFYHMMSAHILLQPSGHDFFVDGNDTLLESALRVGMPVNYGCSNGNCGKCKARLIEGEIKKIRNHDYVFSEAEKLQGYFLMCSHTAVNDLIVEADEAENEDDIPIQSIDARLKKIELHNEVAVLNVRMPRTERLRFMAGQYVDLGVDDSQIKRCYIASCPCDELNMQFHISRDEHTALVDMLLAADKNKLRLQLKGPYGNFIIDKESEQPLVFIAYETGFAPIKGLIENAIALEKAQSINLILSTSQGHHYMHNQARAWEDALDNFHYSELQEDIDGQLEEHLAKLSNNAEFYIAGPQAWAANIEQALKTLGVADQRLAVEIIN